MSPRSFAPWLLALAAACGAEPPRSIDAPSRALSAPQAGRVTKPPVDPRPVRHVSLADVGLDASILDRSVDACTDLYQLACGSWLRTATIPDDAVGYERSFSAMRKATEASLHAMLESAQSTPGDDPGRKMLGDFYAACLDERAVDAAGARPVRPLLDRLERATSRDEIVRALAGAEALGVYALVHTGVEVDALDSSRHVANTHKTGWGLHRREYVENDERSLGRRAHYAEMLRALFTASGATPASVPRRVRNAMTIETLLSIPDEVWIEGRAPSMLRLEELEVRAPAFPWRIYLRELGLPLATELQVLEPAALGRLSDVLAGQSLEALRDYAQARVLHDLAHALGTPFREAKHRFAAHRSGVAKRKARWRECLHATEHALPRATVRETVRHLGFDREDPALLRMIEDVYDAWRARLDEVEWLDAPTRAQAKKKLSTMPYHVGHPVHAEVERFDFDRRAHAENVFRAHRAARRRVLGELAEPPDRTAWTRSPLEVNAYHDHERNSIFLHLAMLQPPIYDARAALPVRYGVMGMTIAHEIAHGFDHHGARYDERGTRRDWWSPATAEQFASRKACFERQFSTYEILPGLFVDGVRSVGENIADVAGLRVAYRAYRTRRADAREHVVADGFTDDQQFFLARAQAWCVVMTDDAARDAQRSNPHIAPRWAVNGPVHHLPEFQDAFGCAKPKDVCSMW